MRIFPIIPTEIMIVISILFLIVVLKTTKKKTHILMILLLFCINERFMIPNGTVKTVSNNVDVLFVVDSTISMNAEDYNGNEKRLNGVKKDCKQIIEELNGARFSLITFNNTAKIMIPYTKDSSMMYDAIDIIEPITELYARGSSLNTPIDTIKESLNASYKKDPDRLRILFFISDGEITDESKLNSYAPLKNRIDDGMVLGYGTTTGGSMKYKDLYAEEEKDILDPENHYEKAISKIDEKNLKKIANDLGLNYIHMDKSSKMNQKLKSIKSKIKNEMKSSNKKNYEDIYYLFAIPLFLLILWDAKQARRNT